IASEISVAIVGKADFTKTNASEVFGAVLKEVIQASEDTLPGARVIAKDITISYIRNDNQRFTVAQASKIFGKILKEVYSTFPEGKMLDEYLGRGK
ncbi:MAG: hypothetical protein U9N44_05430, partial [Chloroflexota bacterium]|nr:hypothetical protein [Chloroflexota bacterium]